MNRYSGDLSRDESSDDLFEDVDLGEEGDDPDDSILGEFAKHWEDAGDERARDGIIDDFCGNHPHLRDVIRKLVEARRGIGGLISVDAQKAPDPERLGPYKILRLLACGGMGRVYEAKDGVLPRKLAVKTIQVDRGSIPRLLERFQSERRALARLHHTNIIPIFNAGEEDGLLYFAMPLIRGPNLDDLVAASAVAGTTTWDELLGQATIVSSRRRSIGRLTNGRESRSATTALLPPAPTATVGGPARPPVTTEYVRHVAEIVAVAAEALHSAHEVGVLHFDVKPSNILIEPLEQPKPAAGDGTPPRTFWDGVREGLAWAVRRPRNRNPSRQQQDRLRTRVHPWVIDFGLANPTGPGEDDPSDGAAGARDGTRGKGTKGFMSPEMLARCDGAGPTPESSSALGPHTDVWGLGVTLYQLLTLHLPFEREFDLRLMSTGHGVSSIPTEGKDLIVVAAVNQVLHFRILDGDGKMVVDTDEKRLTERLRPIEDLKDQLENLWPPHELTRGEKGRVIAAVMSIVGHTLERDVLDPKVRPKPPTKYVADLPPELEAIVLKALQKPVDDRYATAAAFAEDLRRWLAGFPTEAGRANILRRSGMWARRRPAQAGLVAAGVFILFLITVATVYAAQTRAAALTHELDILAVQRLRQPTRHVDWFANAWKRIHSLRLGSQSRDEQLQGQAAATLEGIDAHTFHSFDRAADMLAFDPTSERLLMGIMDRDDRGRPVSRLAMGNLAVQQGPLETTLPALGVVGFRHADGVPLFLEQDRDDPAILRLRDASTGNELMRLAAPLTVPCAITAHNLSRDGTHAAAIVWPTGERTQEARGKADPNNGRKRIGDTATLVVWDVATGRVVRTIEEKRASQGEKQASQHEVVLSPDGSLLAIWDVYGPQHDVAVWTVNDGTLIERFSSIRSVITSVAFGRDPVWREDVKISPWRLAVGEHGGMITLWNLKTRAVKSLARGTVNDVKTIDFSPDGSLLASAGRNEVRIWDTASGTCLLTAPSGIYASVLAFSPDGRHLAVGKLPAFGASGGVDVYDLEEGRGLRTLRGLQQRIEKVVVSGDGRRVAALSNDWELAVFDKVTGALLGIVEAPEGYFPDNAALALSTDGTRLVCSAGTEARLWEIPTDADFRSGKNKAGRLAHKWTVPPALTEAAGFRSDGRLILVRQETKGRELPPGRPAHPKDHPRVCRAYELREQDDPKLLTEIFDFNWYVEHVSLTYDAGYVAVTGLSTKTGEKTRIIHLYDGSTWTRIGSIPTNMPANDALSNMRFDPKGTRLHVLVDRDRLELFEVPSLKPAGSMKQPSCVNVGASRWVFLQPQTPEMPEMLVLEERGRDIPLLRIVRDVSVSGAEATKFSPDGNSLVWGNMDGTVTVCDLNEVQRRLADVGLGWP